jgi:hypothetical protein
MATSETCKEDIWLNVLYNITFCHYIFVTIVREPYALQRIKCSKREQSIPMLDITTFKMLLSQGDIKVCKISTNGSPADI